MHFPFANQCEWHCPAQDIVWSPRMLETGISGKCVCACLAAVLFGRYNALIDSLPKVSHGLTQRTHHKGSCLDHCIYSIYACLKKCGSLCAYFRTAANKRMPCIEEFLFIYFLYTYFLGISHLNICSMEKLRIVLPVSHTRCNMLLSIMQI